MKEIPGKILLTASLIAAFGAAAAAQSTAENIPVFSEIFREDAPNPNTTWQLRAIEITIRLFVAVILSGVLAFRPRRNIPFFQRNLYVVQTQILLAVVAAALMMIVGDSAARAFGIFAAVSVVRFRTNIRDPKEITVLLISLALGLAAGVGRWELGAMLGAFAVALLWLLEHNESERVFRAMELRVKSSDPAAREMLENVFKVYDLEAEIREIEAPAAKDAIGSVMYLLNLPLSLSTSKLSEQILALPGQIVDLKWEQPKHTADIYQ